MGEDTIGTCDDCGAEHVPIWLTEYNWQCAECKTEDAQEMRDEFAAPTSAADQRTRWARLWKRAAQKYYVECWRLRGILKGERARREDAESRLANS